MRATDVSTIEDLRRLTRARLPKTVFDFIDGGADDELTLRWNSSDFDRIAWNPRVLVDVGRRDTSGLILGRRAAIPLIIAPTGLAALAWAGADAILAQSSSAAGVPFTISTSSSVRMEAIREAAPEARLWFQAYPYKDRSLLESLLGRARAIDCEALVVTADVPVLGRRLRDRRNRFMVPLKPTLQLLWDLVKCPRWTWQVLTNGVPRMRNFIDGGQNCSLVSLAALMTSNMDPSATWELIQSMRDRWQGKLVLKGILHPQDAERAVRMGVDAIAVSNHGGRQLDAATSSIRALPGVVAVVGGRAEVYLDGGIRRGSDIAKARALGATGAMAGRAGLYGVGAAGRVGADHALAILTEELDRCLALVGCRSTADLNSTWVHCRCG